MGFLSRTFLLLLWCACSLPPAAAFEDVPDLGESFFGEEDDQLDFGDPMAAYEEEESKGRPEAVQPESVSVGKSGKADAGTVSVLGGKKDGAGSGDANADDGGKKDESGKKKNSPAVLLTLVAVGLLVAWNVYNTAGGDANEDRGVMQQGTRQRWASGGPVAPSGSSQRQDGGGSAGDPRRAGQQEQKAKTVLSGDDGAEAAGGDDSTRNVGVSAAGGVGGEQESFPEGMSSADRVRELRLRKLAAGPRVEASERPQQSIEEAMATVNHVLSSCAPVVGPYIEGSVSVTKSTDAENFCQK